MQPIKLANSDAGYYHSYCQYTISLIVNSIYRTSMMNVIIRAIYYGKFSRIVDFAQMHAVLVLCQKVHFVELPIIYNHN